METFYSAESKRPAESEGWSDGFLEIVIVSKMFFVRLVFRSCFLWVDSIFLHLGSLFFFSVFLEGLWAIPVFVCFFNLVLCVFGFCVIGIFFWRVFPELLVVEFLLCIIDLALFWF